MNDITTELLHGGGEAVVYAIVAQSHVPSDVPLIPPGCPPDIPLMSLPFRRGGIYLKIAGGPLILLSPQPFPLCPPDVLPSRRGGISLKFFCYFLVLGPNSPLPPVPPDVPLMSPLYPRESV